METVGLTLSLAGLYQATTLLFCLQTDLEVLKKATESAALAGLKFGTAEWSEMPEVVGNLDSDSKPSLVFCEEGVDFAGLRWKARNFDGNVAWLVPQSVLDGMDLMALPLRLDSQLMGFRRNESGDYLFSEYYGVKGKPFSDQNFGSWSSTTSELDISEPAKWERRSNLQAAELVNTVLPWRPMIDVLEDGRTVGLLPDVLGMLKKSLNFTTVEVSPSDGEWGVLRERDDGTGAWTGMVAQLKDGEADICGSSLSVTLARYTAVDFTVAIAEDVATLFVPNPAKTSAAKPVKLFVYLTIFTSWSWLAIWVMALAFSVAYLQLVEEDSSQHTFLSAKKFGSALAKGFSHFFLNLIQRATMVERSRVALSAKIFALSIIFLTVLLYECYVSDLTATMTAGGDAVNLRSFGDVVNRDYTVHIMGGTFVDASFASADPESDKGKVHKEQTSRLESPIDYPAQLKALALSQPNSAVFEYALSYAGDNDLVPATGFLETLTTQVAFGLQKDSEFRQIFDHHLYKIFQTGLLRDLRYTWLEGEKPSDMSGRIFQQDAQSLGFENLLFPQLVLLAGLVIGGVLCVVEFVDKFKKSTSDTRKGFFDAMNKKSMKISLPKIPVHRLTRANNSMRTNNCFR